ncbi:MAG: hypothetical protein AAFO81_15380 [Pseudomonadota bacterium]
MYIGNTDLAVLHVFLEGYRMAMEDTGASDSSDPNFSLFHQFVNEKYGFGRSTAGWANVIKAVSLGHSRDDVSWDTYDREMTADQKDAAMRLFYSLLDEYKANAV